MRPVTVTQGVLGPSRWVPINWRSEGFAVGLGVKISSGATLTWGVQHTFDNPWEFTYDWSGVRASATGTITRVGHGLSVGDWVMFAALFPFDREYAVATVADANTFTVTGMNAAGALTIPTGMYQLHTAKVFNHQTLTGKTTSEGDNYAFPARACRLNVSAFTGGTASLTVIHAG